MVAFGSARVARLSHDAAAAFAVCGTVPNAATIPTATQATTVEFTLDARIQSLLARWVGAFYPRSTFPLRRMRTALEFQGRTLAAHHGRGSLQTQHHADVDPPVAGGRVSGLDRQPSDLDWHRPDRRKHR